MFSLNSSTVEPEQFPHFPHCRGSCVSAPFSPSLIPQSNSAWVSLVPYPKHSYIPYTVATLYNLFFGHINPNWRLEENNCSNYQAGCVSTTTGRINLWNYCSADSFAPVITASSAKKQMKVLFNHLHLLIFPAVGVSCIWMVYQRTDGWCIRFVLLPQRSR